MKSVTQTGFRASSPAPDSGGSFRFSKIVYYFRVPAFIDASRGYIPVPAYCRSLVHLTYVVINTRSFAVPVADALKAHTKYLWFDTKKRREYICITNDVDQFLQESGIKEGFILVSAMHITAGVYINDLENGLIKDIDNWLEELAPVNPDYHHHNTGEDNGDAHLKRILINHQVMVPVTEGKLDLGPWEQIFYAEFDGQRRKRVILKAIGM